MQTIAQPNRSTRTDTTTALWIDNALVLQSCHGNLLAASYLAGNGVKFELAMRVLTGKPRRRH